MSYSFYYNLPSFFEENMMSLVSIRLDDNLFREMKTRARVLHLSQTDYIRRAIIFMNKEIEKKERRERLKKASMLVRKESIRVNAEFSDIEYDLED